MRYRLNYLQRRVDKFTKYHDMKQQVKFFNSDKEFQEAKTSGHVRVNDICFIDDIPDND